MRDAAPPRAAAASSDPSTASSHPLALSVMRLTIPLPNRTNAMPFIRHESSEALSPSEANVPDPLLQNIPPWEGEGAPCGVGAMSVLPASFGSIYASETFRSFISVYNQSTGPVQSVSISVQIQTSTQTTISLLDTTPSPRPMLDPKTSINNIVKIPLPDVGMHKLLCAASYRVQKSKHSQIRTYRQVFRFNVLPPLEPSLSVIPLYKGLNSFPFPDAHARYITNFAHYLVDLRVLNAVPVPVYLTDATFIPCKPFRVRSLLRQSADDIILEEDGLGEEDAKVEARNVSMGVGDARNFLFHVYTSLNESRKETARGGHAAVVTTASVVQLEASNSGSERPSQRKKSITSASQASGRPAATGMSNRTIPVSSVETTPHQLGHITISWRSALGENGHLDNIVTAMAPVTRRDDVEVSIYAVPEQIHAHRPFVAKCAARNNTGRAARLYLQIRRDLVGEIVPVGVSGVSLGEVQPGCTVRCSITLIPLVRGQHTISGVRVVDIDSNKSFKADAALVSVS